MALLARSETERTSRSRLAVGLVVLLLVTACSGGGGGGGDGGSTPVEPPPTELTTVGDVADALARSFGGDALRIAVLAAAAGYSMDQLGPAALEGRVTTSGDILGGGGRILTPAHPEALGLLTDSATRPAGRVVTTVDFLTARCERTGASLGQTGLLFFLVGISLGYSPDQLIEALLVGTVENDASGLPVLIGADGRPIRPALFGSEVIIIAGADAGTPGASTGSPPATPACGDRGIFVCEQGPTICADQVCNGPVDCNAASDEDPDRCDDEPSCCVATAGCPSETGSDCGDGCCCCPFGQVCDRVNPRNGCIAAP